MKNLIITAILAFGFTGQASAQSIFDLLFKKPSQKEAPVADLYKDGAANVLRMDVSRTIELIGVVNGSAIEDVAQKIDTLSVQDQKKPIYIFINSPGGSVGAGTVVLDAMTAAKRRGVKLVCASGVMAASMGYIILAACDERYTLRNTKLLFHPMSISVRGARVGELHTALGTIKKEEAKLAKAARQAMGMGVKEYYRHYFAETMWPASVLKKRVPSFITIVDDISGTNKLFQYKKPGFNIFGNINLPVLEKLNQ